jgi:hypothetical protein
MGIHTRPLKRNTEFDKKLAAIHLCTDVRIDTCREYSRWQIGLNDKLIVDITKFRLNGGTPFVYDIVVSSGNDRYFCYIRDRLSERTWSAITVPPVPAKSLEIRVYARWVHGKWTVSSKHYPRHYWPPIQQLGYVLA